ncbi:MAG: hypothetical protein AAF804_11335 [Bacteroidota bacterium]
MKKPKLKYTLIILASLFLLAATIYVLQAPHPTMETANLIPMEQQLGQAVSVIEDSLAGKAWP